MTDTPLYVLHFTFCAEWFNISYPISSTRGFVRTWGAGHGFPTFVPAIKIIVFVIVLSQPAKFGLTFKIIEQILEFYYCIRDSRFWWGKPEGKRPLGRSRRRCENNINDGYSGSWMWVTGLTRAGSG